jgi:predicted DsbA family dithiol-disulfide isomerase
MDIDVIFDPTCPWCYIGKRRLEEALALRPKIQAALRWRPFLLNPEIPPEGIERNTYLINKFGSEARMSRVYGAIKEAGQSVAIDFDFDHIRSTPNTLNAHRLVHYSSSYGKSSETVEALFFNYFIVGKDIGSLDLLIGIGESLGLAHDELFEYLNGEADIFLIYQENAAAHHLGIGGAPSFVFNHTMAISGAHEAQTLARIIDAAQGGLEAETEMNLVSYR